MITDYRYRSWSVRNCFRLQIQILDLRGICFNYRYRCGIAMGLNRREIPVHWGRKSMLAHFCFEFIIQQGYKDILRKQAFNIIRKRTKMIEHHLNTYRHNWSSSEKHNNQILWEPDEKHSNINETHTNKNFPIQKSAWTELNLITDTEVGLGRIIFYYRYRFRARRN